MKRGAFLPLLLALGGCAGMQSALDPAGDQAESLGRLFWLMIAVCGTMYLLVCTFLVWSIARRRRGGATPPPGGEPEDAGLSRALLVWVALIVAGVTLLAGASFVAERSLSHARTREALTVRVTGHQWWWRIQYLDPGSGRWIETANELHLPAGNTARVVLRSADVIHSFWVPNVSGKMDMIPGRANSIDVTPRRIGWFRGQCAEFCGAQHAHMALDVTVESAANFTRWLARQAAPAAAPADPVIARGQAVVTGGACAMCHVVRGTAAAGRAGPDLTHLGSRRTIAAGTLPMSRGALAGWIGQPQALKPGTTMPAVALSGADQNAAALYLESLK